MTLTDTHAHLDFRDFAADFADVLARAEAAGVRRIVTIGTSLEGSRRAVELAHQHPNVFAAIGVHPNNATDAPPDIIAPLRELARHPKVVAIGECGLDYHRLPRPELWGQDLQALGYTGAELPGDAPLEVRIGAIKSAQAAVFEQQLDLAVELGLNVVIHERDAWPDTLELLSPYAGRLRAVFHCFGKGIDQAHAVIAQGHLVSFTGIVTFKNAPAVHESAAQLPAEAFMVETDCPYLAPIPHRGKRCEPAHVRLTAERVAQLRGQTLEEISRQTESAAETFFRFERARPS